MSVLDHASCVQSESKVDDTIRQPAKRTGNYQWLAGSPLGRAQYSKVASAAG